MREKAPFIWTSKQLINSRAMLAGMNSARQRKEPKNRWFLFRREFNLDSEAKHSSIKVTVDGRYQFFVNGQKIGRGPARSSPLFQRYDTWDITDQLRRGKNTLTMIVRVFGEDLSWYEQTKGLWQPVFGDGGLWLSGEIETTNDTLNVSSDESWRCIECTAWLQDTPNANHGLSRIEVLDSDQLPEGWMNHGFNDDKWDTVQIMEAGGGGPESSFGGLVSRPFPHLLPNPLKPLNEDRIAASEIVWIKESSPISDVAFYDELYQAPLFDLTSGAVTNADAMLNLDDDVCLVTTSGSNGISILLDFEKIRTMHPFFEIEAVGGEIIDIAVNERLPNEWQADFEKTAAKSRIERKGLLGLDAHFTRYIAKPGVQVFERFEWQAVKWMQINIRNADSGLKIKQMGGIYTRYPTENRGSFTCSDPILTKLWKLGRYTLQQCMHDSWEDCPGREQRQWLGDATVENLVGHAAFGQDVKVLNAEFIRKCAESQRPDGLTQMFAPGNHGTNGLLIPDWTLQWILNSADHYNLTGDLDVIEEVFPSIQKALAWFERGMVSSGLVQNQPYWLFMDWSGFGREGQSCALNAQLAGSFRAAASLAKALEMPRSELRYERLASTICAALNLEHWEDERGIYVDQIDPKTGKQGRRVSQHSNAAMILWGDAPQSRWESIISWITDADRLTFTAAPPIVNTGAELDEETGVVMANTFFSHFVFEALGKAGRVDLVFNFIRERYGSMIDRGATTLWESFNPTASLCHGFSASPTWQMTTKILGLYRNEIGQPITFKPNLIDLDHASGNMAFLEGDVKVSLVVMDGGFMADLELPVGLKAQVDTPPGYKVHSKTITNIVEGSIHLEFQRI